MPGAPRRAARPAGEWWGTVSALRRGKRHRTGQGEGKDRALRRVLSLPLDPHSLPALGWCCLRRTGASPLVGVRGDAPVRRLGSLTLRTRLLQAYLPSRAHGDPM